MTHVQVSMILTRYLSHTLSALGDIVLFNACPQRPPPSHPPHHPLDH